MSAPSEADFRLSCGRDSDREIFDALKDYFRRIGWHDAVRVLEMTAFGEEIPDTDDEKDEA